MSRRLSCFYLAATVFVVAGVLARWQAETGFSALVRFGHEWDARRLPAVVAHPHAIVADAGYDGQFYAQLAVDPNVLAPEVQRALDLPQYRARRILLPAIAHVFGCGSAWAALNIFALLNLAAWLVLAWHLRRYVAPMGMHGVAIWAACLLGLGALDSIRFSLTDLPAMLALFLAVEAWEVGRKNWATFYLALGGLVRETSIFAVTLFAPADAHDRGGWRGTAARATLAALPLLAWSAWLALSLPRDAGGFAGNFDWPGFALVRQLGTCVRAIAAGDFDGRFTFGLLAAVGLAYQSCFVLRRATEPSAWIRVGLPFAVLFWVLGDFVWHGYWAVARACLPLTFAYNLTLPRDRHFGWRMVLGNAFLVHGLVRFFPG